MRSIWRQALDSRGPVLLAFARAEFSLFPESLLVWWGDERARVAAQWPDATIEEAGWIAWARARDLQEPSHGEDRRHDELEGPPNDGTIGR